MLICYTLDGDAWDRVLGSFDYLKAIVRSHRGVFFFFIPFESRQAQGGSGAAPWESYAAAAAPPGIYMYF